jgi:hypothetical protein
VVVGKPLAYNPINPAGQDRRRLREAMDDAVRTMFLDPDPASGMAVYLKRKHKNSASSGA